MRSPIIFALVALAILGGIGAFSEPAKAATSAIYFRNDAFAGTPPPGFGCTPNLATAQTPGGGAMEHDSNSCWYLGPIAGTFPGGDFTFHIWLRADIDQMTPPASMDVVDSVDGSEPTSHSCDPQSTIVAAYAEYICTVTGTEPYATPSGSYTIAFTLGGGSNFHTSVGAAGPGQGFSYGVGDFFAPQTTTPPACALNSGFPGLTGILVIIVGVGILFFAVQMFGIAKTEADENTAPKFVGIIVAFIVVIAFAGILAMNLRC